MSTLGILSDTHGLLRPEALEALRGVELIVHAGDIGSPDVIGQLERVAPVHAVRGNVDRGLWSGQFSDREIVEVGDLLLYVLHDLAQIDLDPAAAGFHVVVFGHSHTPSVRQERGVIYLNPGSIGPRRFRLPIAMARLIVGEASEGPIAPGRPGWAVESRAFHAGEIPVEVQMLTLDE